MYHIDVSQADYYNFEFICSLKKIFFSFLYFIGYLDIFFSMSLRIVLFLFVYVVPQSSMDDGFCNSSRKKIIVKMPIYHCLESSIGRLRSTI